MKKNQKKINFTTWHPKGDSITQLLIFKDSVNGWLTINKVSKPLRKAPPNLHLILPRLQFLLHLEQQRTVALV